jgi:hypothetical protein
MAELIARFKPGQNVPGFCTAQVLAGHLVSVNGVKTVDGDYPIAHTGAGLRAFGVAERDSGPTTDPRTSWTRRVNIVRPGAIARVISGAAIDTSTGSVAVKSDATGRVIPQGGTGIIVGYAVTSATAADQVVEVDLNN